MQTERQKDCALCGATADVYTSMLNLHNGVVIKSRTLAKTPFLSPASDWEAADRDARQSSGLVLQLSIPRAQALH